MSRDPEATRRECARMLKLGEEYVSRFLRSSRPAPASGAMMRACTHHCSRPHTAPGLQAAGAGGRGLLLGQTRILARTSTLQSRYEH
jgi:hypothetical protein